MPEVTITYPGIPASVPSVRRFVRRLLAGSSRVDDLELIAAELATNAIRHTSSGQAGGTFTITVRHQRGLARLEVADQGSGQWPLLPLGDGDGHSSGDDECGRGLTIVAALADGTGLRVAADGSQVLWVEIAW